jgi:DNA-binding CsgD family transcriptional regulator
MPANDDRSKLRDAAEAIRTLQIDAPPAAGVASVVHDLLGSEKTALYSLQHRRGSQDLGVDIADMVGFPPDRFRRNLDQWLCGQGVDFTWYNPLWPQPEQRNKVLGMEQIQRLSAGASRLYDELYPKLDARGHYTLRVLLCEGPSFLGYVGILQPDVASGRQRSLLRSLVKPLHARLTFERALQRHAATQVALDVALDEIAVPAYVINSHGQVLHANVRGRPKVSGRDATTRDALRRCASDEALPGYRALRCRDRATVSTYVVIERDDARWPAQAVNRASRRLALTPSQTRVLDLLAQGLGNAAIAATLSVAERTVETHLTAIFEKAQVSSRASLIAWVFSQNGR